ncbi:MAG: choice-of-anchor D domain-containing protein [Bacteroidetes bacterium]|nr:choice-of-anchor D domain-containing protein [Bacteroidota bacterium]
MSLLFPFIRYSLAAVVTMATVIPCHHLGAQDMLWDSSGVAVCTADGWQRAPRMIPDGARGTLIAWEDMRTGSDPAIYTARITADAQLLWQSDGVEVAAPRSGLRLAGIVPDNSGGAYIAWWHRDGNGGDLAMQRIDGNGNALWTIGGITVCDADGSIIGDFGNALCDFNGTQERATMISDGHGGGLAVWQDKRNGFDYDLYMNRISSQGQTNYSTWNGHTGVLLHRHDNNQLAPQVIPSGEGYAIICWYDGRVLDGQADIYAQRVAWAPSLAFPDSVDFGIMKVGQTVSDTVRIRNTGATPLIISNIRRASDPGNTHPRDFTLHPTFMLPDTLLPDEGMNIVLSFAPEGTGARSSELRISSDAPQDPVVIPLHGLGTNPRLRAKNVHQFAVTKVGAVNEETVEDMLRNTGTGLLLITSIAFESEHAGNFGIGDNGPFPLIVDEGKYFPLKVRFAPDRAGTFVTTMIVHTNSGEEPGRVRLSGFGAHPSLIPIPVALHFDSTMETRSTEAKISIRNTSGVELVVTAIRLGGADADQFSLDASLPMRIPVEGLSPFTVRFRPTSVGFKRALIIIDPDASTSPDSMVVDGAATVLGTDALPAAAEFSVMALYPQPLGSSQPLVLRLAHPASGSPVRVRLFDLLGRMKSLLYEGRLAAGSDILLLPTDRLGLVPGMYTLEISDGSRRIARGLLVRE